MVLVVAVVEDGSHVVWLSDALWCRVEDPASDATFLRITSLAWCLLSARLGS